MSPAPVEHLLNGGFEIVDPAVPTKAENWNMSNVSRASDDPRSGLWHARMIGGAGRMDSNNFNLVVGLVYTWTFYMKPESAISNVEVFTPSFIGFLGDIADNSYQPFSGKFVATTTSLADLKFQNRNFETGNWLIDDCSFTHQPEQMPKASPGTARGYRAEGST